MECIKRYPYMGEEELEFYFKTEMVNIEISEVCKYEKIKREDIKTYFVKYGNLYLFLNNEKKVEIELGRPYFEISDMKTEDEKFDSFPKIEKKHNIKEVNTLSWGWSYVDSFVIEDICEDYEIDREKIVEYEINGEELILILNNGKKVEIETSVRYFDYKYLSYLMENNIIIGEH